MNKVMRRSLSFTLLALCVSGMSLAQDQGVGPVKEPVVVARFSIASLDAITKTAKDLQIPIDGEVTRDNNITEPQFLRDAIEEAPFLSPGSVSIDRPMGIVVIAGDPHKLVPLQDSMAIVVPVNTGKATGESVVARGGTALEGQKDSFKLQDFLVRRTAGNLIVKQNSTVFGLGMIPDDVFLPDYREPSNIAVLSLNFEAMRKAAPEAYKEVAAHIGGLPSLILGIGGVPAPEAGKPVIGVMDKLNKFTLALGQDDANIHVRSFVAPSPVTAKSREMPRPAFPEGTFLQIHVIYPDAEAAGFIEKQLALVPESTFGGELPPVYHDRVKTLVLKAAGLNSRADAVSLGVALKEGMPVVYLVGQLSAEDDMGKELAEIAQEGVAMGAEAAGAKFKLEESTYEDGGKKVRRLVITEPEPGKDKIVIDALQNGKTVYLTVSPGEGKQAGALAAAGMKGTSSVFCAGALDLGEAFKAASDVGGLPGLTADQVQKLKGDFAGQGITWTVQPAADYLYTDVQIPRVVIRKAVAAIMAPARPGNGLP